MACQPLMQRFYCCYEPKSREPHRSTVGASLLAKASYQSPNRLNDTPHSRASSLPQDLQCSPK
ncbi:hypothetical protein DBR24_11605 [Pseudomonas sp. HMWF006]|nr:hypothetical protein DBR24_11605 [Pseudomonas sp. HMWF006]PTT86710.1 hypothetical protein DBR29_21625 [Pseudomonas sp. HMWF005]